MIDKSESTVALSTALALAQAELSFARKDAENPGLHNKYADLPSVWEACRKPLTSHGLSVMQLPLLADPGCVRLQTILLHESGEWIAGDFAMPLGQGNKGVNDAQAYGSTLTYMRRYALAALVGVVQDDDDASSLAPRPQPAASPPAASPPAGGAKPYKRWWAAMLHSDTLTVPDPDKPGIRKLTAEGWRVVSHAQVPKSFNAWTVSDTDKALAALQVALEHGGTYPEEGPGAIPFAGDVPEVDINGEPIRDPFADQ